jgi:site-specific DNA-methyltransferase (adenine-specific)
MDAALFSSMSSVWRTQPALFNRLHDEFYFAIDAAANGANHLCDRWFGPDSYDATDALAAKDWQYYSPRGAVFCNPPFARAQGLDIAPWIDAFNHQGNHVPIVALIPARTDTRWFHDVMCNADEIRLIPHRVKFLLPDGTIGSSAPFPSAVAIWKPAYGRRHIAPRFVTWDYL